MNEEIPWIGPPTWQAALAFCADKIKDNIDMGVRFPSDEGEEMLGMLRQSFDELNFMSYGRPLDNDPELKGIITDRLIAYAVLVMQMNNVWDNQRTSMLDDIDELLPFLESKQKDYGYENISRFGLSGLYVRMHDKISHIENLVDKQVEPQNESLMDSMVDFVGYCLIGLMLVHDMWLLPMAHPQTDPEESLPS